MLIDQINQTTDPQDNTDMEMRIQALFDDLNRDALRYQELYYTERKHISNLDEQRCAGYSTGDQLPA